MISVTSQVRSAKQLRQPPMAKKNTWPGILNKIQDCWQVIVAVGVWSLRLDEEDLSPPQERAIIIAIV